MEYFQAMTNNLPICTQNYLQFGLYFMCVFNSFKPEFAIVIFIHYKPRIATAILDL